jgi:hypothetical protein
LHTVRRCPIGPYPWQARRKDQPYAIEIQFRLGVHPESREQLLDDGVQSHASFDIRDWPKVPLAIWIRGFRAANRQAALQLFLLVCYSENNNALQASSAVLTLKARPLSQEHRRRLPGSHNFNPCPEGFAIVDGTAG